MSLDAEKRKIYGNSTRKIPQESLELMDTVIVRNYKNGKKIKSLYMEYKILCLDNKVPSASYQTFCKELRVRELREVKKYRFASDKFDDFNWTLGATNQNHVGSAFEVAHTYHTELDIALDIGNGKTARPWCTLLIDVFSRRILSFHLTFAFPSTVSNVLVIKECFRKHNTLPQTIVVDGGKEFHSKIFDSFLAKYDVRKKVRPFWKVRYNVVEQLFRITNKSFINMLLGSTQIMKNKQKLIDCDPLHSKNHSVWNLDSLQEMLAKWIDEVYDVQIHPAHLNTPKDMFNNSIATTGNK